MMDTSGSLRVTASTNILPTNDSVVELTISIESGGRVYGVSTNNGSISINIVNVELPTVSITKLSTLTSITEGEDFEITLTVSPIQTIDLPVTLTTTDNDLGYFERFDPSPIMIPANSETMTVTVFTKDLPAYNPNTNFRISVDHDVTNSNPNLRYVAASGDSGFVDVAILNKPRVQITSLANESSVFESTAFTFTLMATPAPAANKFLPITLTLSPENTLYFESNFKLTYNIDSSGTLAVTVPTNLVNPGTRGDNIEITIVENPDLYVIREDYEKIQFGISKNC